MKLQNEALYLNTSSNVSAKWQQTIDTYYAVHLNALEDFISCTNLEIEELEVPMFSGDIQLYRLTLTLTPKNGAAIELTIERQDCTAGIDYIFGKAKRALVRRMRQRFDFHRTVNFS